VARNKSYLSVSRIHYLLLLLFIALEKLPLSAFEQLYLKTQRGERWHWRTGRAWKGVASDRGGARERASERAGESERKNREHARRGAPERDGDGDRSRD
jgi:hypothetical protein